MNDFLWITLIYQGNVYITATNLSKNVLNSIFCILFKLVVNDKQLDRLKLSPRKYQNILTGSSGVRYILR